MASNYPPGVTGFEYEISGPEWEKEVDKECPEGHKPIVEMYHRSRGYWAFCTNEDCFYYEEPIEYDDDEPDWDARAKDALIDEGY